MGVEDDDEMKRRRHTPGQIVRKVREADRMIGQGASIAEVLQHLEVTEATYYRWCIQYGAMSPDEAKRPKGLEVENARPSWTRRCSRRSRRENGEPGQAPGSNRAPGPGVRVSQRWACRVLGTSRSSLRRCEPDVRSADEVLRARLLDLARQPPRFGFRRLCALLPAEGSQINHKRVSRLCREEGLRVRGNARKRRRVGVSTTGQPRLGAQAPNEVRALDFQFDATADGQQLKLLNIVDECTREALAIVVARAIDADATVAALETVAAERGTTPAFVRMDNGPELTSAALRDWCRFADTAFIEPGAPWQNAYVESFNGCIRDELLSCEMFDTLTEARILAEDWRIDYNWNRPHSALGHMTPAAFAATLKTTQDHQHELAPESGAPQAYAANCTHRN